jgi:hypothetical protein
MRRAFLVVIVDRAKGGSARMLLIVNRRVKHEKP